jgi:hypothetical protein
MQTSAWQCWPLCSICSDQRLVPPQKNFRGTQAAAKRKVVGIKRNRKASCGRGGAWGRGAGRGGCGRGLGRLVCFSSEEEADIIAPDVNQHVDTGADATQEQVMPVQAHPHVQCARAAAAAVGSSCHWLRSACNNTACCDTVPCGERLRCCVYVALELLPVARIHMIIMCTCLVTYRPRREVFTEFAMRSQAP